MIQEIIYDLNYFMLALALVLLFAVGVLYVVERKHRLTLLSTLFRLGLVVWFVVASLDVRLWRAQEKEQPIKTLLVADRTPSVWSDAALQPRMQQFVVDFSDAASLDGPLHYASYQGPNAPLVSETLDSVLSKRGPGPTSFFSDFVGHGIDYDRVVVLTDGKISDPIGAVDLQLPVHLVVPDNQSIGSRFVLKTVKADAYGLVRSPLQLAVDVDIPQDMVSSAYAELVVDGQTYRSPVSFRPNTTTAAATFEILPLREGALTLSLDVYVPGQPYVQRLHHREHLVRVLRDRLRVLHVVGRPTWDTRFFRETLRQNATVDLISFQILRTHGDRPGAKEDALSLIPFPIKELFTTELKKFDVVILHNFDYRPYIRGLGGAAFGQIMMTNLVEFVEGHGGGLLMIAGDLSYGFAKYELTSVGNILPVTWPLVPSWLSPGDPMELVASGAWRNSLPPAGDWPSRVYEATLRSDAEAVWQVDDKPVVATRLVGAGRTASILTDEMWQGAGQSGPLARPKMQRFVAELLDFLSGSTQFDDHVVQWTPQRVQPGAEAKAVLSRSQRTATETTLQLMMAGEEVTRVTTTETTFRFRAPAQEGFVKVLVDGREIASPLEVGFLVSENFQTDGLKYLQAFAKRNSQVDLYQLDKRTIADILNQPVRHRRTVEAVSVERLREKWWFWLVGFVLFLSEIAVRRRWQNLP